MKILFNKQGVSIRSADAERRIFCIDNHYYNEQGNEIPVEESFLIHDYEDEEGWYEYWMDDEGLEEPLKSESVIEPVYEIDDLFGQYGFKNEAGEFVIEPQYAYAFEFTNGLAAVNLNRTWYRTENGHRYYENHYGYIDHTGKTVIPFRFNEAFPFNKYGVALVSDSDAGWFLIDQDGNEIPGTKDFEYISRYYYENRFLEFSSEDIDESPLIGVYDTKLQKILMEPSISDIVEQNEDLIRVYVRDGKYGEGDFHQYYINSNGEILFPWLYDKGFAIVEIPDKHNVAAVAITRFKELDDSDLRGYFLHNGKKYDRKFLYGLYSSKGEFLLPLEYDEIRHLTEDIWCCKKDGIITVVRTEDEDGD